MSQKNPDEIGALWSKRGSKGDFLSGNIEIDGKKIEIVCFINQHKKEAKHPDYRILISRPQGERKSFGNTEEGAEYPPRQPESYEESGGINPEDMPF